MNDNTKKSLSYKQITKDFQEEAISLVSITLSDRQVSDLELILNGGFNPLNSFMNKKDYDSVLKNMRLHDGQLWPIPITLDIDKNTIDNFNIYKSSKISLRDKEGFLLAIMKVEDIWKPNKKQEAKHIYGTDDINHPGVNYLYNNISEYYV